MRLDNAAWRDLPPVTRVLASAFFFGWLAHAVFKFRASFYLGLVPFNVTENLWLWQPLTYQFLHGGFWHFLFNAFMLWMLGRVVEPAMGSRRFLLYFLGCGAAAGLFTAAWSPSQLTPVIGASGAVFALLAAFAWLFPHAEVYLYFLFPMKAWMLAAVLGLAELAFSFASPGSGVSNVTHLGGLLAGLAWLWTAGRLERRGPPAPEPDPAALEREDIDRLLGKVSAGGRAALSRAELARLDDYARRRGGRA